MMPPGNTIEELLELSLKQMNAMTPDELEALLRPACEKQAAIIATMPAPKGAQTINLSQRGRGSNAVANAIVADALKNNGITPDMLARFGIKIKT